MSSFRRLGVLFIVPILLWANIDWSPPPQGPSLPEDITATTPSTTSSANIIELVNHLEPVAHGISIQGNYAYVGGETGLSVLDISNPISPTLVGTTALFSGTMQIDGVRHIDVTNVYAYVTVGRGGLRIIDISEPTAPVEIGSYNPGFVDLVEVANAYTYITDSSDVEIIDTSTPTNLVKVAVIDYSYEHMYFTDIEVTGDYLFISEASGKGGGTQVLDVSDPTDPFEVSYIGSFEYHHNVAAVGEHVYISLGEAYFITPRIGGLQVMDISSPTHPIEIGSYKRRWPAYNMVVGDYVYLLGDYGLRLIDISDSAHPVEVSFYNKQWEKTQWITPARNYDLAVVNDYIYVAAKDEGLFVFRHATKEPSIEVSIDGPTSGVYQTAYRFTALISPTTVSLPFTYTWAPEPDMGQGTAVVTYTWQPGWFLGTDNKANVSVMAVNAGGTAIDTHTISFRVYGLYLPLVLRQDPTG